MEGLVDMFRNLRLAEFTWRREPILYVTLAVAVLQVVAAAIQGDIAVVDAAETVLVLIFGFLARGQVTPTSKLPDDVVARLS